MHENKYMSSRPACGVIFNEKHLNYYGNHRISEIYPLNKKLRFLKTATLNCDTVARDFAKYKLDEVFLKVPSTKCDIYQLLSR